MFCIEVRKTNLYKSKNGYISLKTIGMEKYLLILVDEKANINKKNVMQLIETNVMLGSIETVLVPCPDLLYWADAPIPSLL